MRHDVSPEPSRIDKTPAAAAPAADPTAVTTATIALNATACSAGPAFPLAIKVLATLTVVALVLCGLGASREIVAASWTPAAAFFMVATFGVICTCYYWILFSTTSIDAASIRQTWAWNKEVALADIRDLKFIYIPYLAWLIAPRLMVRARGGALYTFHAADRQVLQRFAVLRFGAVFSE